MNILYNFNTLISTNNGKNHLSAYEIQELEEAVGYLTKEDEELIMLLFFEEFTVKETAQYFGCCTKTIRNRRKKVLEKLKEKLLERT